MRNAIASYRRTRRLGIVAISVVVAIVAAVWAHGTVKPVAVGSTRVFVDTAAPSVVHRAYYQPSSLIQQTEFLARVMTSPPVVGQIAGRAGVPANDLAADARITIGVPVAFTEAESEERASEIRVAGRPYRIQVQARPTTPVLDIYTQAPSTEGARRLADAAV